MRASPLTLVLVLAGALFGAALLLCGVDLGTKTDQRPLRPRLRVVR